LGGGASQRVAVPLQLQSSLLALLGWQLRRSGCCQRWHCAAGGVLAPALLCSCGHQQQQRRRESSPPLLAIPIILLTAAGVQWSGFGSHDPLSAGGSQVGSSLARSLLHQPNHHQGGNAVTASHLGFRTTVLAAALQVSRQWLLRYDRNSCVPILRVGVGALWRWRGRWGIAGMGHWAGTVSSLSY
jgi:hypothetical protein